MSTRIFEAFMAGFRFVGTLRSSSARPLATATLLSAAAKATKALLRAKLYGIRVICRLPTVVGGGNIVVEGGITTAQAALSSFAS